MQEPGTPSTSGAGVTFPLVSLVWLQRSALAGLFQNQDPALLIAREGGSISLVTLQGKLFEAEKRDIVAAWPWYQLGQGVRLTVAGKSYGFAWVPGSSTSRFWPMRKRAEVVNTLAVREGLPPVSLAESSVWRSYLEA